MAQACRRIYKHSILILLLRLIHTNGSKLGRLSRPVPPRREAEILPNWQRTVSHISEHNTTYASGARTHSIILLLSPNATDCREETKTRLICSASDMGFQAALRLLLRWTAQLDRDPSLCALLPIYLYFWSNRCVVSDNKTGKPKTAKVSSC